MSKKVRIKFSADFGFSNKFYEKKPKNTRKTWKSTESFLDKKKQPLLAVTIVQKLLESNQFGI